MPRGVVRSPERAGAVLRVGALVSASEPERGAYLVDTVAVAESDPFSRAFWTGCVQYVRADGTCRLITVTGYEWTPAAGGTRPATDAEREAYERGLATGGRTRTPRAEAAVS